MNYEIIPTNSFKRKFKDLAKKYHSLTDDIEIFKKELLEHPDMGDDLGNNTRKVRMAITSKNKGKRGGARIITYHLLIDVENASIYLLTIYDKGEQESISSKDIEKLKQDNRLL